MKTKALEVHFPSIGTNLLNMPTAGYRSNTLYIHNAPKLSKSTKDYLLMSNDYQS